MKRMVKILLILMVILTTVYITVVAYANINSSHDANASDNGKKPIEYGILKAYFAERLETEPSEWNTTEELGITFGEKMEYAETETYEILITNEEKALPWMNDTKPEPYAVKYEDKFYNIVSLWVGLGLPESVKQWQIPIGAALGAGWVFTGALFVKGRKKE